MRAASMRGPSNRTSETGKLIDLYLKGAKDVDDHAVHLLFSANRWESMKHIRALLEQGTTLVVDRYAFSGVAYSAAKGLDLEWCKQPDRGLLRPDLVLFLDLDPIAAARRAGYGEERYERVDMQQRVRSNFMSLADGSWKILDASRTVDEIAADVSAAAIAAVEAARSTPLCSDLWCS
nr:hypothetical protein HK105_001840 [Polyrhizophydium stewartii]